MGFGYAASNRTYLLSIPFGGRLGPVSRCGGRAARARSHAPANLVVNRPKSDVPLDTIETDWNMLANLVSNCNPQTGIALADDNAIIGFSLHSRSTRLSSFIGCRRREISRTPSLPLRILTWIPDATSLSMCCRNPERWDPRRLRKFESWIVVPLLLGGGDSR